VIRRGEIWWASLPEPSGSEPGYRRPVVVVQIEEFTASRLRTVLAVPLTSNLELANASGNTLLPKSQTGLPADSVANISQLLAVDKRFLTELAGEVPPRLLVGVEDGLRLILGL
jgi:mRNA interferase MazF